MNINPSKHIFLTQEDLRSVNIQIINTFTPAHDNTNCALAAKQVVKKMGKNIYYLTPYASDTAPRKLP